MDTLYGMKVPATPEQQEQCDDAQRMNERGRMIDRANWTGSGQPTVPDTPRPEDV